MDNENHSPPESTVPPAAPPPSRRAFLAMSVGGAALVGGVAGASWLIKHRGEDVEFEPPEPMSETGEIMAERLRKQLDMLELPDATVAKWVNKYEAHVRPFDPKKTKKIRRKDLQRFLLSTDFFPNADEDKALRFVAYYDPYISVCYNPLRMT